MDATAARLARARGGVISLRDADRATAEVVDRRVAAGDLARTGRRSAVAATTPLSFERRLWVAQVEVGEPMAFSGPTAAAILGIHAAEHPGTITAMIPTRRKIVAVDGVSLTRAQPDDLVGVRVVDGHPVTSVEVTIRELARVVPESRVVGIVQDQLRLRTTTESRLRSVMVRGRAGAARLGRALDVAGDGAHSRAERALHAALRAAGATGFRRQVAVSSPAHARYCLDLLFDEAGVTDILSTINGMVLRTGSR